ncbi:Crp/Fnr family transcriptional regulator [Aureisphaera galaxeae]|uniref:Crp/Fnr family transcriptional regulator n=1 Tax=Aureisphaera galaxeae TaxID=1538023 RepID=UPI0023508704|nr:Crp/Fnr family transcriptional regulator [Aureisphaera galaxeae]MDC8002626.1 Crp/Fnr family transcriptional regulator [Aureisphaera galaxeae]
MERSPEHFETYLKTIIDNPAMESGLSDIQNAFRPLSLFKNSFFVEEGQICPYFCYIENGILQHSLSILGEEKTTYLALRNSCTAALKSFRFRTPSRKNIRALSDCDLWVIELNAFEYLLKNNPTFYTFYYNLIENQIYRIDDYRIDLLTLTPEERYQKMLENEPKLLQQVPLHYLASFLGISTRHMSRIRKNVK